MELCANLLKKLNKIAVIFNFLAFLVFSVFYLKNFPSWIRILNAGPDPGDKMNADPCGSGSTALIRIRVSKFLGSEFALIWIRNNAVGVQQCYESYFFSSDSGSGL